jgi:hypothetical protein
VGSERTAARRFDLTITRGKVGEIDLVADPDRLRRLDLVVLDD